MISVNCIKPVKNSAGNNKKSTRYLPVMLTVTLVFVIVILKG